MDLEFHYYITAILARVCLKISHFDALKIAYSSQFVDDNKKCFCISSKSGGLPFLSCMTQSMDITLSKLELESILVMFHFLPNIEERKLNFVTMKNSEIGSFLVKEAYDQCDLYLIGLALHAYHDSFVHQNFSGIKDPKNSIAKISSFSYGHAYFGSMPDKIGGKWLDVRGFDLVINNKRIQEAIIATIELLAINKSARKRAYAIASAIFEIIECESINERIEKYLLLYINAFGEVLPKYCALEWEKAAFYRYNKSFYWKRDFEASHWYCFQLAIKKYKSLFVGYLERQGVCLQDLKRFV